jgi:ELWxxDGT repeat protein
VKYELWSSNGTQAGTRRLASLDWPPTEIISAFSRVFFNGITDETGSELWTSDGTVAGTIPLDFAPAANAWPYLLTSTGTRLFTLVELKVAEPRDYRSLLWQSDGTSDGTVAVPGVASGNINGMVAASGRLVFTQYMPGGGTEMWSTDGTEQGLTRLADFVGSLSHSDPVTTLYFPRQNSDSRSWELWKSDGTSSGTVFVKALSLEWPDPGAFQEIDNLVYFRVCTRANGCEPWVTDGTTDGTRMIRDLIPGSASSYPSDFTSLNGHVLFSGNGRTLWKTDGTESGTALVRQIEGSDGYIHGITALPDRVVFGVGGYGAANQLWTSDGTTEGTMRIATFAGPADAIATNFARLGNLILFTVDDGVHGRELWKTDGTAGGTTLLKDVNPGPRSMNEGFGYDTFAVSGLRLVFTASDPEHGSEVFITDGTTEGTRLLTDINPGPASSNAYEIEIVGPRLFVAAGRPDVGYELFTVVLSAGDALDDLARQLDSLGFARGTAQSLKAKLQAADQAIDRDDHQTAMNILEAFITELLALRGKKLSEPDADALISAARQIIEAL